MNDFEKLGHFFADRFVIEYFDSESIYLAIKEDNYYDKPYTFSKLSKGDYDFLKKYLDVIDYEDFEDERK